MLIVYLERRKPEVDYSTLDNLARHLASYFWSTIEKLAPNQADPHIDREPFQRWRDQVAIRADGKGRREFEPILRAVRAVYADLQAWAAAEPEQWAIWVAPCPASNVDVHGFGMRKRRVKVLSTLVVHDGVGVLVYAADAVQPPIRIPGLTVVASGGVGGVPGGDDGLEPHGRFQGRIVGTAAALAPVLAGAREGQSVHGLHGVHSAMAAWAMARIPMPSPGSQASSRQCRLYDSAGR
jgi:hypothetical protein